MPERGCGSYLDVSKGEQHLLRLKPVFVLRAHAPLLFVFFLLFSFVFLYTYIDVYICMCCIGLLFCQCGFSCGFAPWLRFVV